MPDQTLCPYEKGCNQFHKPHRHPYAMGHWGAKRCVCGNRRWRITAGARQTPLVSCDKCGNRNYSASAYEAGRHDGHREVPVHAANPF